MHLMYLNNIFKYSSVQLILKSLWGKSKFKMSADMNRLHMLCTKCEIHNWIQIVVSVYFIHQYLSNEQLITQDIKTTKPLPVDF